MNNSELDHDRRHGPRSSPPRCGRRGVARLTVAAVVGLVGAGVAASGAGPVAAGDEPTVVASGLDQPRGLTIAADGSLLVAEAGRGGSDGCVGPILTAEPMCLGPTGAVTQVKRNGQQRRIVEGLPSIANQSDGNFAFGPADVSTDRGRVYVAINGPGDDLDRSELDPAYADALGTVQRLTGVRTHLLADLAAFEAAENPHPTLLQSNTQAVQTVGRRVFATDAAGNTVHDVTDGDVDLVAVLPDRTSGSTSYEAVPSGLAEGPDGALYLSDVTGAPFPTGGAMVWRLGPNGFVPYATGFTTAIDLAFGPDGSLYVVENFPGRVLRLDPGATDASGAEVVAEGLTFPTGIAVRDDGAVYVSDNGVFAGIGRVVRIG